MPESPQSFRVPILRLSDIVTESDSDVSVAEAVATEAPKQISTPSVTPPVATGAVATPAPVAQQPTVEAVVPRPIAAVPPTVVVTEAPAPVVQKLPEPDIVLPVPPVVVIETPPNPPMVPAEETPVAIAPVPTPPTVTPAANPVTPPISPLPKTEYPTHPVPEPLAPASQQAAAFAFPQEEVPEVEEMLAPTRTVGARIPEESVDTERLTFAQPLIRDTPFFADNETGTELAQQSIEPLQDDVPIAPLAIGFDVPDMWEAAAARPPQPTAKPIKKTESRFVGEPTPTFEPYTPPAPPLQNMPEPVAPPQTPEVPQEVILSPQIFEPEPVSAPTEPEVPVEEVAFFETPTASLNTFVDPPKNRTAALPTPPSAPKSAGASGANLAALRERILQQNITLPAPDSDMGTPMTSTSPDTMSKDEAPIPTPRPLPTGKHANAIAQIAQSLRGGQDGAPTSTSSDASVPTAAVGASAVPPPPQSVAKPLAVPAVSTMRTLKSDVTNMVTHNQTSVVDMISAEEFRKSSGGPTVRRATQSRLTSSSYILIGASAALLAGAVIVGFIYYFSRSVENESLAKNYFFPEQTVSYNISNKNTETTLADLTKLRDTAEMRAGFVTEIRLEETIRLPTLETDQVVPVTATNFMTNIAAHAPTSLIRAIADRMMLGIYRGNNNQPYLIFDVRNYENAYAGMLAWETTMSDDLSPLFGANTGGDATVPVVVPTATSTATTTPVALPIEDRAGSFEDRTVANVPVRVQVNAAGAVTLLWSMPDNATILITTSTDTFESIRGRMTTREY